MLSATFPAREDVVLAELLSRHAARQPDKTFAVFADGQVWTYRRTAEISWTVAAGLIEQCAVGVGDVVAGLLPNGPEALAAWFGTNCTGASFAPLNTAYRGAILEHALNLTRARLLFIHAELLDRLAGLSLNHLRYLVFVGDGVDEDPRFERLTWAHLTNQPMTGPPQVREPIQPWHDMVILMTSGTTGASKAVRRTCIQYSLYTDTTFSIVGVGAEDRFYVCGPMFHGGADTPIFSMLQLGASIAVSHGFSVSRFWDEVRETNSTVTWIYSSMSLFLAKQLPRPGDADNPLRLAMLAPMIPGSAEFAQRFDIRLYMVYGMTELPCVFSVMDPVDDSALGRVADPGYEARIVDADDIEVPDGTPGELIVRHRLPWAVTPGYLHNPEATARSWRNGWFHSGDVFVRDAAGEYRLVDRVKDSIRRRGENVSAAEVETALLAHPDIVEAAVIGVASELEEDVLAYVSVRRGHDLGAEAIHAFLVERLPYFAVPRYIVQVDMVPRNVALRPDKPALRKLGVPANAWDREAAGISVSRERLSRANAISASGSAV